MKGNHGFEIKARTAIKGGCNRATAYKDTLSDLYVYISIYSKLSVDVLCQQQFLFQTWLNSKACIIRLVSENLFTVQSPGNRTDPSFDFACFEAMLQVDKTQYFVNENVKLKHKWNLKTK